MKTLYFRALLWLSLSILFTGLSARAGSYSHNFDSDPTLSIPPIQFRGTARWVPSGGVGGSGYVSLTDASFDQHGKVLIPDIDLGLPVGSFVATMKIRIGGGTPRPADGFSFNFADPNDPAVTAADVGGWIAGVAEEGTATGLAVSLDTWDNGGGEAPSLDVKLNGVTVASTKFSGVSGLGDPVFTDAAGNPVSLETGDQFVDLRIELSECGALSITYKGLEIYKDLVTGFTPRAGRFVIGARTGGAWDNHWIDDVSITTTLTKERAYVRSVAPTGRFNVPLSSHVVFTLQDSRTHVNAATIQLVLDEANVTSSSTISFDSATGRTTIDYAPSPHWEPSSTHVAVLTFTDDDPLGPVTCTARKVFTTTLFAPGSLFIEAEDFNFSDSDNVNPGQHANFGDDDCSLLGKDATLGIDYVEVNDGNDQNLYRAPTGVEAGKPGADDPTRGERMIECNYIVGWNDAGDWFNYTRDFGAIRRYNIYARMASGGPVERAQLDLVTSDPTQPNQTLQKLGTFESAASGSWDVFHTVPLKDSVGNLANVRLGDLTTLRLTALPGAFDFNWIALVPAAIQILTPTIVSVEPRINSDYARAPKITVVIADADTILLEPSVRLFVDDIEVTDSTVIVDTPEGAIVEYQSPTAFPPGTLHTAHVEWFDNQDPPAPGSFTWNWTEGIYNAELNLFIEAEDFNSYTDYYPSSGAGQPFNAKGLYDTLSAFPDLDYRDSGNPEADVYRKDESPNVGMAPLDDSYRTGAGPRPGFEIIADYKIGWTDSGGGPGGDWYNYTRNWPENGVYQVYLRAAHGDPSATMGGRLDLVPDRFTYEPTLLKLGTFRAPATGGWDTFTFIPLKDDAGNFACVKLSGEQTLRYTVQEGGCDINYLMFCPVSFTAPVFTSIRREGSEVVLEWTGIGVLELADDVAGPWVDMPEATSPLRTTPEALRRFARIRATCNP